MAFRGDRSNFWLFALTGDIEYENRATDSAAEAFRGFLAGEIN